MEKWVEGKSNKDTYLWFFAIFDDFSKWSTEVGAALNFENYSNMAKNENKPCSTYLKANFRLIPCNRKSDLGYPFRHY